MFEGIHAAVGYLDYFSKDQGGLNARTLATWKKKGRYGHGGGGPGGKLI